MSDLGALQDWTSRLEAAADRLSHEPTMSSVFEAMGLLWQTDRIVGQPATPPTALAWMRLTEALVSTWNDLTAVADSPGPILYDPGPALGTGVLDDTPQVRAAVARLLTSTAGAVRELSADEDHYDPDAGLDLAIIAATLDDAAEDWP